MKKDVLVLGAGRQGNIIARTLNKMGYGVEVWDTNEKSLKSLSTGVKKRRRDFRKFKDDFSRFDLIVDALPSFLGIEAMKTGIKARVSVVSISFTEEAPFFLDKESKNNGIIVIPDAGLAPGLSNLLAGFGYSILKGADTLIIKVGGIPLHPEPPFNYEITWSPEDLIDEYMRIARIKRNGKIVEVPALSDTKREVIGIYKEIESFITDGLRTLLHTLPIKNMEERTIRYRGHAEIIKMLKSLGLFDYAPLAINDKCKISPKKFTSKLLSYWKGNGKDLVLLKVIITHKRRKIEFSLIERGKEGASAMARTTGYTAVVASSMFLDGLIKEKGIIPLEILGMNKNFTYEFLNKLNMLGIHLQGSGLNHSDISHLDAKTYQ